LVWIVLDFPSVRGYAGRTKTPPLAPEVGVERSACAEKARVDLAIAQRAGYNKAAALAFFLKIAMLDREGTRFHSGEEGQ
jgi:hypothetical protein